MLSKMEDKLILVVTSNPVLFKPTRKIYKDESGIGELSVILCAGTHTLYLAMALSISVSLLTKVGPLHAACLLIEKTLP